MSQGFDPYYKWLGIPLHESPPNHYRLLGISLFESDSEVIENALNQRVEHLRSFATGAHAMLAQRLLNEIATVGVCLLRPVEKHAYDTALRAATGAGGRDVTAQPITPLSPFIPAGQELLPPSGSEVSRPFDPLDDVRNTAMRARGNRGAARRASRHRVTPVVGILLSSLFGFGAGVLHTVHHMPKPSFDRGTYGHLPFVRQPGTTSDAEASPAVEAARTAKSPGYCPTVAAIFAAAGNGVAAAVPRRRSTEERISSTEGLGGGGRASKPPLPERIRKKDHTGSFPLGDVYAGSRVWRPCRAANPGNFGA